MPRPSSGWLRWCSSASDDRPHRRAGNLSCPRTTDLRKSFTGLYALVRERLVQEPLSGAVFVFCNRRRDTVKLFCYDQGGFCVCAKRLEAGTFRWPVAGTHSVELTLPDLTLLLSGIDPTPTRVRRWWRPAVEARDAAALS